MDEEEEEEEEEEDALLNPVLTLPSSLVAHVRVSTSSTRDSKRRRLLFLTQKLSRLFHLFYVSV